MRADLVVTNISEIATPTGHEARRGSEMNDLRIVRDASIVVKNGIISYAGPAAEAPSVEHGTPTLDARGKAVIPGFVDSHTHFVFGGYRTDEFFWRAEGIPYMTIHERGGGIRNSVRATRIATLDDLVAAGRERLDSMLSLGVTTVEGKSGYGLDLETELRQLEAMRILAASHPVDVVPTFLGAHSVPDEFRGRSGDYVAYVAREVLPEIARRPGLARFCDVFCEKGVFSVDESRALLHSAKRAGFELKIHADEIERTGGSGLAAELGARSADHLLKADPEDIRAMAKAGVVATCLPLTAFTLGEPFADARMMIESGCAVAVASDFNPGSCPSHSIPLAIALSVLRMGMTMAETLTALTLNGAAALGLADATGSVEAGKRADFLVLADEDHRFLAYRSAMDRVAVVVKDGLIAREKRDVRS